MHFDDYRKQDAVGLAALVRRREASPLELLEVAIARADAMQPSVGALAQRLYDHGREEIRRGLPDAPLTGVPFLLKNLSAQLAGTVTTGACRLLQDAVAPADSTITERYRQAGLVIFGKTNSPEFGLSASTESTIHGTTRNPWNLQRTAGGSSGGAAAAVAAGIVPAAHASDGGGSIRIPASCCGLFGLKPTRARTPVGPWAAQSWGSLGVMHVVSRSVRDSAALLDATQGPAEGDPYMAPAPARPYVQEVATEPPRLRVALQLASIYDEQVDDACVAAARDAARLLESLGHAVEEAQPPAHAAQLAEANWILIATGVAASVARVGRSIGREVREGDVEPVTWRALRFAAGVSAEAYAQAQETVYLQGRRMAAFHRQYDIVLSPTLGQAPIPFGPLAMNNPVPGDYGAAIRRFSPFTNLFNMTGQPSMSVPLYWSADGLPVGVMFSAAFGREDLLFQLAGQLEGARSWFGRVPADATA
ncbi:MAG TPA: amidase [Ramlibacter sp.]|jgi:Asp-tRNA(Asn)/Glu-tRNA(Gln) amidotransferase A subunit family amidase|nr:amidase [Ramlibacter sp.]